MMKDYTNQWNAIDDLLKEQDTKTALEKTKELRKEIQEHPQHPLYAAQLTKALIFINSLEASLTDHQLSNSIKSYEKELLEENLVLKPVLESVTASSYLDYLRANRYKMSLQTSSVRSEKKIEDLESWSSTEIRNRSIELVMSSIQNEEYKKYPLASIQPLLNEPIYAEGLIPTVYDLLLHRALKIVSDFQQLYKYLPTLFKIKNEIIFADSISFCQSNFIDSAQAGSDFKFKIFQLFQAWEKAHLEDKDPKVLVFIQLLRLEYVLENVTIHNKTRLYYDRLAQLSESCVGSEIHTEVLHRLAKRSYQIGEGYHFRNEASHTHRWKFKEAYDLCADAIQNFPSSFGAKNCKALQSKILSKSLSVELERINAVNQPILAYLEYQNVSTIYCKIIRLSPKQLNIFKDKNEEKCCEYINVFRALESWSVNLPNEGDYHRHSVEIALPALERSSSYVLLVSENAEFSYTRNAVAYSIFYVSDIAFVHRKEEESEHFIFTNRTTGKPLEGLKMVLYQEELSWIAKKYKDKKVGTFYTDKDGFISTAKHSKSSSFKNFRVELYYKKDTLYLNDKYFNQGKRQYPRYYTAHFFLDRSIYRPNQTLYFKIILISRSGRAQQVQIVPNQEVEVVFYNRNHQKVESVKLITNEFGSIQGTFITPNQINGRMYLTVDLTNDRHYFRVEEYKRPKFETKFKPVEEAYRLGDKVVVKGWAKAYAGDAVDEAKVTYRVYRQARYPYWQYWNRGRYTAVPSSNQEEIKHGVTITNKEGEFELRFEAKADLLIPASHQPEFIYKVQATVTDNTGETHSTSTIVRVGYIALSIQVPIKDQLEISTAQKIEIISKNLNGEYTASKGTIRIQRLITPEVVYKKRYWQKPDYYKMNREEFLQKFPNYAYQNEDEFQNWNLDKNTQLEFEFNTEEQAYFMLENLPQGRYLFQLKTKDKYDVPIELNQYFIIHNNQVNSSPLNDALFLSQNYLRGEPREVVQLMVGTWEKIGAILFELEHLGVIKERRWIYTKDKGIIPIAIKEAYRGHCYFHVTMIKDGRHYIKEGTIAVDWSNKILKIEKQVFRSTLYPGQEEKWQFKILATNNDLVRAELLVSMYDASLDTFAKNHWDFYPFVYSIRELALSGNNNFTKRVSSLLTENWYKILSEETRILPELANKLISAALFVNAYKYAKYMDKSQAPPARSKGRGLIAKFRKRVARSAPKMMGRAELEVRGKQESIDSLLSSAMSALDGDVADSYGEMVEVEAVAAAPSIEREVAKADASDALQEMDFSDIQLRTNLDETVFFFPDLMTDEEGNVLIEFTMNEALTRWNFRGLAHTQDLEIGSFQYEVVTQKDLMIKPNPPRFLREGDEVYFTAKVSNLLEESIHGGATLQILDAATNQPLDKVFGLEKAVQAFKLEGKRSVGLAWRLQVPQDFTQPITYRVMAKAGDFSDGEEAQLPVLTNRMMLTATLPLPIQGKERKKFEFNYFKETQTSPSLSHHRMVLEFTQNPTWYAIQALPYLMEYPYECTEQLFSRFYANSIASHIMNSTPKIKKVFEEWRNTESDAIESNLYKNQDLKTALLEETPWVLEAQRESEQKKRISLLFDLELMASEMDRVRTILKKRQLNNGGFSWFKGGGASWFITQYLVQGFGHLRRLGVIDLTKDSVLEEIIKRALNFIDKQITNQYKDLLNNAKRVEADKKDERTGAEYLAADHLTSTIIHYIYARSFFLDYPIKDKKLLEAIDFYALQSNDYWTEHGRYQQGLLALGWHRMNAGAIATDHPFQTEKIIRALRENALYADELGMYWNHPRGYFWYQAPIETQALMVEVFEVVAQDRKSANLIRTWLLKHKQTNRWSTTKSTVAACYALLMGEHSWIEQDQDIDIQIGGKLLDQSNIEKEAGTGYFKTVFEAEKIDDSYAAIELNNPNEVPAWGALYWQYFEQMDKVTHFEETPLRLSKELFKEVNTDEGPVLKSLVE
ncbi:MAG: MG2 domain-containing protein, partial [Saprospiraceae bacterium]|nr:MG2 domain-containing protein [Saprospiraceae bacterium]